MRGVFANPQLALEAIQFQSGTFFRQLSMILTGFAQVKPEQLPDHPLFDQLTDCIERNTGIKLRVMIGDVGPGLAFHALDRNHPLTPYLERQRISSAQGLQLIEEAQGVALGTVNLRTGEISGVFRNLGASFLLPVGFVLTPKLSSQEKAAVLLHEIGHYFVYCEFLGRSVTTNYVLEGLSRALDGTQDVEQRVAVIVSAKNALKLPDLQAQELAQSDNATIQGVVISNALRAVRSELGSAEYDKYGFEYLADEYAMRQGAGRYLVTGLDKIQRGEHRSYRPLVNYVLYEALKTALLIPPVSFVGLFLCYLDAGSTEHEEPEARAKRMRNQIVQAMKDKNLPAPRFQSLKADLQAIDVVLKDLNDRRQWITFIWQTFSRRAGQQWQQEKLQKELENLAHSELFVKAQELKNLA